MNQHVPTLVLATLCPGSLAGYALAGNGLPVLAHRDSLAQSSLNVSTQLTKLTLACRYHANPMLQLPHGFCGTHLANPHFATIPFSL